MEKFERSQSLVSHMQGQRVEREAAWRELSRWICPWRGMFDGCDRVGMEDDEEAMTLFTGMAAHAVLKGASGMTSGMTPRNSPWFKPDFQDPELAEAEGARSWLDQLDTLMQDCLSTGGFYQAIQNFNLDLLWAGCALLYSERGTRCALRFESVQVGSFCVSKDSEGILSAVARHLSMPARSVAERFGRERLSQQTLRLLETDPFAPVPIWHFCERETGGRFPVSSLWWEEGGREFLREAGYYEMPYFYATWNEGSTPYGTGPGDQSLPDARQLDILERRKLAGLGKLVEPPVTAPSDLKDTLDLAPGGINYMPTHQEIRPILDLSPYARAMQFLQEEIRTVAGRLQDSLMASIFASIPLNQRPRDMSATEFLERKREALQQLGPVISAYEPDVLLPVLNRALMSLDRAMQTPRPPRSLADRQLAMKVDFISPMANAMRQSGAEAARSLLSDVAMIYNSCQNQEIYDKLDLDQTIDELARAVGAPGGMVRADADVARIRQQRASVRQQEALPAQAMQVLQMGKMAREIRQGQGEGAQGMAGGENSGGGNF